MCRRSSTTCSTCRHFRASLAADVGYCAKDRWRTPLTGRELRACWEEGRRAVAEPGPTDGTALTLGRVVPVAPVRELPERRSWTSVRGDGGPLDRPDPMRLRGFVPIEDLGPTGAVPADPQPARRAGRAKELKRAKASTPAVRRGTRLVPVDDWETRVSLFGEADL